MKHPRHWERCEQDQSDRAEFFQLWRVELAPGLYGYAEEDEYNGYVLDLSGRILGMRSAPGRNHPPTEWIAVLAEFWGVQS